MARFLVNRILFGILVLFVISVIVFALFFIAPHDVARTIAGKNATPETVAAVKRSLGLDKPLIVQYGHFLNRLVHGDLGYSYYTQQSVNHLLLDRLPATLSLVFGAAVIWVTLGVFNGVVSAVRPRSLADRGLTGFALFFYSMPTFLLGLIFLYFLYYRLTLAGFGFFPPSGYVALTDNPWDWFKHLILPWFTLALVLAASYTRLTRGSLLDVLGEDYIRTARAKGLGRRRVIYRHGLRSALTPVLSQLGIDLGTAVGGVIITETVFSLSGLGTLAVNSVTTQDLPVIIGITLFASFSVVVANILVDIGYAVLDPRVRLH